MEERGRHHLTLRQRTCCLGETSLLHARAIVENMTEIAASRSFMPWFCLRRRSGAHNVSVYCLGS
jgi:hypothetical protein